MLTSLKIKNIDFTIYKSLKLISISVYFSKLTKNYVSAFVFIIREIYLINNLKVKMFIENDFLKFEKFIIDVESKKIDIESCKSQTSLKIQLKDFYVRRTIHVQ